MASTRALICLTLDHLLCPAMRWSFGYVVGRRAVVEPGIDELSPIGATRMLDPSACRVLRRDDPALRSRVLLICGSPRSDQTYVPNRY